jgi:hypothetical protein
MNLIKDFLFDIGLFFDLLRGKEECILDGEPNDEDEYQRHMGVQ